MAVCLKIEKAGHCPQNNLNSEVCKRDCDDDADCRGDYKCCVSGCSQICTAPEENLPVTSSPHTQAINEEPVTAKIMLPKGRTFKIGGEIHLCCNTTGKPLPDVKWYKDNQELEPSSRVEFPG